MTHGQTNIKFDRIISAIRRKQQWLCKYTL